jgi:ATP:corrinoid adenosyltransferase
MKSGFPSTQLIATGTKLPEGIREAADQVLQIVSEK